MKYITPLLIISLCILGCQKKINYRLNSSRSVFPGRYHYTYTSLNGNGPRTYDMTVSLPSVDDGNSVYIPYLNSNSGATFSTTDSSCIIPIDDNGPQGQGYIDGLYRHDTLFIFDHEYTGLPYQIPYASGIGVKY
ncbi:MAG: hypothetical protein JWO03_2955 [Bacteroidetes bacterium]|nr:hypothetical protein [Bacteroidota bacterium]